MKKGSGLLNLGGEAGKRIIISGEYIGPFVRLRILDIHLNEYAVTGRIRHDLESVLLDIEHRFLSANKKGLLQRMFGGK